MSREARQGGLTVAQVFISIPHLVKASLYDMGKILIHSTNTY